MLGAQYHRVYVEGCHSLTPFLAKYSFMAFALWLYLFAPPDLPLREQAHTTALNHSEELL